MKNVALEMTNQLKNVAQVEMRGGAFPNATHSSPSSLPPWPPTRCPPDATEQYQQQMHFDTQSRPCVPAVWRSWYSCPRDACDYDERHRRARRVDSQRNLQSLGAGPRPRSLYTYERHVSSKEPHACTANTFLSVRKHVSDCLFVVLGSNGLVRFLRGPPRRRIYRESERKRVQRETERHRATERQTETDR